MGSDIMLLKAFEVLKKIYLEQRVRNFRLKIPNIDIRK